jgi:hypothetical protein
MSDDSESAAHAYEARRFKDEMDEFHSRISGGGSRHFDASLGGLRASASHARDPGPANRYTHSNSDTPLGYADASHVRDPGSANPYARAKHDVPFRNRNPRAAIDRRPFLPYTSDTGGNCGSQSHHSDAV